MKAPTEEQLHELENWLSYLYALENQISERFIGYTPLPKVLTRPIEIPQLLKRLAAWQSVSEGRLNHANALLGKPTGATGEGSDL